MLLAATETLLKGIESGSYTVDSHGRDTRPIHSLLFQDLAPAGHPYYAGTYRGSHQKCLRNYNVGVPGDGMVGTPAPKVLEEISRLGSAIVRAANQVEAEIASPDKAMDPAEQLVAVVRVACDAFVKFLTIHPFADGNGHTARSLLWIILRRFGYVPDKWTIEPRPPILGYGDAIALHRRGDAAMLEQFVLSSISPVAPAVPVPAPPASNPAAPATSAP